MAIAVVSVRPNSRGGAIAQTNQTVLGIEGHRRSRAGNRVPGSIVGKAGKPVLNAGRRDIDGTGIILARDGAHIGQVAPGVNSETLPPVGPVAVGAGDPVQGVIGEVLGAVAVALLENWGQFRPFPICLLF